MVFAALGFSLRVPSSDVPGETSEDIALTCLFYVPLAFLVSAAIVSPLLRRWQLRDRSRVAAIGSWVPGAVLGVVFYLLDAYTRAFHVFTPLVRVLWE